MSRKKALAILARLEHYASYKAQRDFPAQEKTTQLSRYLKFGMVSPREVKQKIAEKLGIEQGQAGAPLLRQLYWRDFFTQVGFHFPKVMEGRNFNASYDAVEWRFDDTEAAFKAWQAGQTGFPLVDAGMRELAKTGYLHNRVRMVVGSFLTKDLHFHWSLGEKHFAEKLVDYDPLVNNGSWQWVASTGCEGAPYFRVFNPALQQKKFDPDAVYIKKWVAELRDKSTALIHNFEREDLSPYPKPMVNHLKEKAATLRRFSVLKQPFLNKGKPPSRRKKNGTLF